VQDACHKLKEIAPDLVDAAGEVELYQGIFALDARIADFG
jgi:hypothetical protein